MKTLFLAAAALCCALISSAPAEAQVEEGSLRLYLDLSLLSFDMERTKAETALGGLDYVQRDNRFSGGPGAGLLGGGALGVGYVVSEYLIPTLHFAVHSVRRDSEIEIDGESSDDGDDDPDLTQREFELRPMLEVPFFGDRNLVPQVNLGLSVVRRVTKTPGDDTSRWGIGPTLGVGLHAFLLPRASFDLGLTFRSLFINDDDREEALEGPLGLRDIKFREYALMFNVGASFWL